MITRISSGIKGLDQRIQGGYPVGESILVTGEPGTGKTIMGVHFLYNACNDGKKCAMVATEEHPGKIVAHSQVLGLDLEPFLDSGQLSMIHLLETRAAIVEKESSSNIKYMSVADSDNIIDLVKGDYDVIILDNLGTFSIGIELKEFRDMIDALTYVLAKQKSTSIVIMDATAHELSHRMAEYSTYGTIRLMTKENPYTGKIERFMQIPKMRATRISLEAVNYDITEEGIKLLSRKKEDLS